MSDGFDWSPNNIFQEYLDDPTVTEYANTAMNIIEIVIHVVGIISVVLWYSLIIIIGLLLLLRCLCIRKKTKKVKNSNGVERKVKKTEGEPTTVKKSTSWEELPNNSASSDMDGLDMGNEVIVPDDVVQPMMEMKDANFAPPVNEIVETPVDFGNKQDIELADTKLSNSEFFEKPSSSDSEVDEPLIAPPPVEAKPPEINMSSDESAPEEDGAVLFKKEEIAKDKANLGTESEKSDDSSEESESDKSESEKSESEKSEDDLSEAPKETTRDDDEIEPPQKKSIISDSDDDDSSEPSPPKGDISESDEEKVVNKKLESIIDFKFELNSDDDSDSD